MYIRFSHFPTEIDRGSAAAAAGAAGAVDALLGCWG
jgi:hypothetical protein